MTIESTFCPGCGVTLLSSRTGLDHQFHASAACRELYDTVCSHTLSLRDREFIHQLVVDAYAAQHVGPHTKPITATFALVGLYLVAERNFTGRQVQRVHMLLAGTSRQWPHVSTPPARAALTVEAVVSVPEGDIQAAIRTWNAAVWQLWKDEEAHIAGLVQTVLGD